MIKSDHPLFITDKMLAEQRAQLSARLDVFAATAITIRIERDKLREALQEVRDLIEDYSDVRDGGASGPIPNGAMRALQKIDEALGASP